jgi:hypothetical protein
MGFLFNSVGILFIKENDNKKGGCWNYSSTLHKITKHIAISWHLVF